MKPESVREFVERLAPRCTEAMLRLNSKVMKAIFTFTDIIEGKAVDLIIKIRELEEDE